MALETNELYSTNTAGPTLRYQVAQDRQQAVTIAAISGAPVLERLTPMAFNSTSKQWVPWTTGVTSPNYVGVIRGFLISGNLDDEGDDFNDVVQTSATDEVLGVIMLGGQLHIDDVPLYSTNTLDQVKAAIEASALMDRFVIQGMDDDTWTN